MAGTYTQTRKLELDTISRHKGKAFIGGTLVNLDTNIESIANIPHTQTTTSFRSGDVKGATLSTAKGDIIEGLIYEIDKQSGQSQKAKEGVDTGHAFVTERRMTIVPLQYRNVHIVGPNGTYLDGPVVPNLSAWGAFSGQTHKIPDPILTSYWGPELIKRAVPNSPNVALSTTVAEVLREGIPKTIGSILTLRSQTDFFRSLGSEYLNVQFGWAPLVRDLSKLLQTVANWPQVLEQYRRDSGRIVRRRRYSPVFKSDTVVYSTNSGPRLEYNGNSPTVAFTNFVTDNIGVWGRITDQVSEQYWFSGAFSYFLNVGSSDIDKAEKFAQEARKLLGIGITPDVLWNLTPWSWLADWVGNIGTNVSNATHLSQDGLVIRWGYLMRRYISNRTFMVYGPKLRNGNRGPFSITYRLDRKERVKATPFGFGLNPNTFSDGQWAILAALGLTKAPKILK